MRFLNRAVDEDDDGGHPAGFYLVAVTIGMVVVNLSAPLWPVMILSAVIFIILLVDWIAQIGR